MAANPRPVSWLHARRRASIQDFDAILFDDRIGPNFVRDGFNVGLRLLARGATGQRDFEELTLTHFGDGGEPEAVERRAHRLALRVENGGLRSYEYASFHGELRLSHGGRRALRTAHEARKIGERIGVWTPLPSRIEMKTLQATTTVG